MLEQMEKAMQRLNVSIEEVQRWLTGKEMPSVIQRLHVQTENETLLKYKTECDTLHRLNRILAAVHRLQNPAGIKRNQTPMTKAAKSVDFNDEIHQQLRDKIEGLENELNAINEYQKEWCQYNHLHK
eukprot:204705_1